MGRRGEECIRGVPSGCASYFLRSLGLAVGDSSTVGSK